MKKSIIYTALLFAFLHFNNASKGQNQLLIKSIVYDVPIYSASYYPENEGVEVWVNNNLEPSKRCFLQQNIINKVVNGKLEVYNELGKKLSKTEVDKILVSKDTILRSRWEPPYSTYDTVLDVVMPSYRINYLRFH